MSKARPGECIAHRSTRVKGRTIRWSQGARTGGSIWRPPSNALRAAGQGHLPVRRYHPLVARLAGVLLWTLLLLTAGLPLAWLLINLLAHPGVAWSQVVPTSLTSGGAPEWHHL